MTFDERPTSVSKFGFFRCLASLGLMTTIFCVAQAQVSDVTTDPRLQKPISIRLKIASLPQALKQLSKLDGVRLENVQTINDLKVTVFAQDVPAGVLLSKIASVLGCQWRADGDLFRLVMDPEERVRRDRYISAEEALARKETETEMNTLAQLASFDAASAAREVTNSLVKNRGGAIPADEPSKAELLKRAANPQDVMLGRYLASLDAGKINAFWRGDVIVGAAPGLPSTSPGTDGTDATGAANPIQARRRRPPVSTPMFVQFDPLLYQVRVAQRGQVREVAIRPAKVVTQPRPTGELAKLAFGKEVLAWDQPIPTDEALSKLSVPPPSQSSGPNGPKLTIADFLERAFDEAGINVVADAFREPAASRDLSHGTGSFPNWLKTLKDENHLSTRVEGSTLLVRHGGFWRLRRFETPEEVLAPFELKAAKGSLSIDEYATLLAKLTPEQAKTFSIKNGIATPIDTRPIEMAFPALQFYASLDARSVSRAMKDGVSSDQLGGNQRQLFVDATLQGVFYGAASIGASQMLLHLAETGDIRGLGFLMRRDSVDVNGVASDGRSLLFGMSLSEASTYKVPLSN